jgi:hypothetical protein
MRKTDVRRMATNIYLKLLFGVIEHLNVSIDVSLDIALLH